MSCFKFRNNCINPLSKTYVLYVALNHELCNIKSPNLIIYQVPKPHQTAYTVNGALGQTRSSPLPILCHPMLQGTRNDVQNPFNQFIMNREKGNNIDQQFDPNNLLTLIPKLTPIHQTSAGTIFQHGGQGQESTQCSSPYACRPIGPTWTRIL